MRIGSSFAKFLISSLIFATLAACGGGSGGAMSQLSTSSAVFNSFVKWLTKALPTLENSALDKFKLSAEGQDLYKCLGVNGEVDWKIYNFEKN